MNNSIKILIAGGVAALMGCALGPNHEPPALPLPTSWTQENGAKLGAQPNPQWWKSFEDPWLTMLIERAVKNNLNLTQATMRVRQARATRGIAMGGLFPSVDVSGTMTRSHAPPRGPLVAVQSTQNLFFAGFDAAWELDIFGGRRRIEAADAEIESAIARRDAVLLSIESEVAATYVALRTAQARLAVLQSNLSIQRRAAELSRERADVGLGSGLDAATLSTQAELTAASIPPMEAAWKAQVYALDVLIGSMPGTLIHEMRAPRDVPRGLTEMPVGLPSELLQRRPDLRNADAQLHAATARIGVSISNYFPKFSLSGSLGLRGNTLSSLTDIAKNYWQVGGGVSWNIFASGAIAADVALQRARAEEALALYQQSVLSALAEVETALVNLQGARERLVSLDIAVASATQAVALATQLFDAGRTNFQSVLTAQQLQLTAQDSLVQSRSTVATQQIALFKALGGGWEWEQDGEFISPNSQPASSVAAPPDESNLHHGE